jgi:murein L,D-transpeptidase YcbB/YkuD
LVARFLSPRIVCGSSCTIAGLAAAILLLAGTSTASPESNAIRRRITQLESPSGLRIEGAQITSVDVLPTLYQRRNFAPIWSPRVADALISLVDTAESHGLDPEDYHQSALLRLRTRADASEGRDTRSLADYDVVLSDALLRIAYHAINGKVDPESLDPSWNINQDLDPNSPDPAGTLQQIIDGGEIESAIESLAPKGPFYFALRRALRQYQNFASAGGWEPVPEGPLLERGMSGPRVAALRQRLAATRDSRADNLDSDVFDGQVERAVKRFQSRHRIDADGVAGKATLEAMNVPVEDRVDQIRVNLERARWVLHGLSGTYVLVDIAGFEASYFVEGERVWSSRVQVGRPFRRTPVFRGDIAYLEINPTWTVPPGILEKDILPKLREDVGYLAKHEMSVLDRSGGEVDPTSIDWNAMAARGFPYRIVQAPGPRNALGRVKFMFPNAHLVFLHDTPSRALFERNDRAFSSGCIRVEHPFELAELLLDDPERWSRAQIDAAVEARGTTRVNLPRDVPVILLYWTVAVDEEGTVHFKRDLYERDAAVLAGLDEEFSVHGRHAEQNAR